MNQTTVLTANHSLEANSAKIVYILYIVGVTLGFIANISLIVWLLVEINSRSEHFGGFGLAILIFLPLAILPSIIGVIFAYVNRADSLEWLKTHYRFQIRTFWIGLLYAFLNLLTPLIVVLGVFTFIWGIVRCVKGLKSLSHGEPYENAATWLW